MSGEQAVHCHVERAMGRDLLQAAFERFPRRLEVPCLEIVPPYDRENLGQDLWLGAHLAHRERFPKELRARLKQLHPVIGKSDLSKRLQVPVVCGEARLPTPDFREITRHAPEETQGL